MKKDIAHHVAKCPNCQHVKAEHLKTGGFTQIIDVPILKWEAINIDFVVGHPKTRRPHDSIWDIVDRITKSAHFITVTSTYKAEDYAKLYIYEIVRLLGIPSYNISDRRA